MSSEMILAQAPGHYCWDAPRPGWTLFGSVIGTLVVTDRRFLFLSNGEAGIWYGRFPPAQLPTLGDIDLDLLGNPASIDVALGEILSLAVVDTRPGVSYLSLRAPGPGVATLERCFSTRSGLNGEQLRELVLLAGF